MVPRVLSMGERVVSAVVALGCLGVLVIAARLTPAPAGHGTHMQMGLPGCGFLAATGHPCPTCGMTTAFAHAAHGHFLASFVTQPFGCVLAIAMAGAFWVALQGAATGSRVGVMFAGLLKPRALWVIGGLVLAAWVYKLATWGA